jgi:cell division protease FtsH
MDGFGSNQRHPRGRDQPSGRSRSGAAAASRFDRRIVVNRPDVKGREGIPAVHAKKIPLADDVNIHVLARGSSGFSGADMANLVNEAALNAARYNQKVVRMLDFEFAKDKVMMGTERRSMIINDEEEGHRGHEAGHALRLCAAERRRCKGDDHPARHGAGRHHAVARRGQAQLRATISRPDRDSSRRTHRRRDHDEQHDDWRRQRSRTVDRAGAQDGVRMGHERRDGAAHLRQKEEQIFLGREIAQHQDYEDTASITKSSGS